MLQHPRRRIVGVLTTSQVSEMSPDELRERLANGWLPPMAGGAPDDRDRRTTDPDDDPAASADRTVPLGQYTRERDRRRQLEADLDDVNARLKEIEDRDKSENDRLKEENAALKAENETLRSSIETGQKQSLVTDAARDAGFHKPGAALSMLDADTLAGIDSEEAAKAAVKGLARREAWMLKDKPTDARTGVEKILKDGREVNPSKPDGEATPRPEPGLDTLRAAYAESSADGSQD